MKQPRVQQDIEVLDNEGNIVTVSRSIALQGAPRGVAQNGPVNICPITNEVMYQANMVLYNGRYYSEVGVQEVIERDSLRNS